MQAEKKENYDSNGVVIYMLQQLHSDIKDLKQEIKDRFNKFDVQFDKLDTRFEKLEGKISDIEKLSHANFKWMVLFILALIGALPIIEKYSIKLFTFFGWL